MIIGCPCLCVVAKAPTVSVLLYPDRLAVPHKFSSFYRKSRKKKKNIEGLARSRRLSVIQHNGASEIFHATSRRSI